MDRPLPNSYWVVPGSLLAGEYPYGIAAADTKLRLQRLLAAGIDSFIDLTHAGERPEYRQLLPPGVDYWRSPIHDAAVPIEAAHMRGIQARLQTALAEGRRVYLHCRAGIGRTGTVVGCYLVEQGLTGEAALGELNRLWQQSERSMSWPEVPQTGEQAEFIRAWGRQQRSGGEAPELTALQALRARFLGALLGCAVGDALGCSTQFGRPGQFKPIADLIGGGALDLPRGAWSDDTALALCLAESLLECQGFDAPVLHQRMLRWSLEGVPSSTGQCVGITAGTARALQRAPGEPAPGLCSEAAPLSRALGPVLYFLGSRSQALECAAASARLTAGSPIVQDCCRLLAAMLHAALHAEPIDRVLCPPAAVFAGRPLLPAVAALATADAGSVPPPGLEPALQVLGTVRWALRAGGGFRAGALRVVNLGGDADVAGAVYGALAGAVMGQAALPAAWTAALLQRPALEALADRLLAAALVDLADSGAAIR